MATKPLHPLKSWRLSQTYDEPRRKRPRVLSISEAARRVGVAPTVWQDWEEGHKIPTRDNMVKICDLTGLMPNDFYFKNGVPYRIARNLDKIMLSGGSLAAIRRAAG